LDRGGGRGEHELVDPADAAMDDGEPQTADAEIDAAGQAAEPGARLAVDLRIGVGVPSGGRALAGAAFGKAAAAVGAARAELLVAIAHDDVDSGTPYQV